MIRFRRNGCQIKVYYPYLNSVENFNLPYLNVYLNHHPSSWITCIFILARIISSRRKEARFQKIEWIGG